jgi:hypothetical protein
MPLYLNGVHPNAFSRVARFKSFGFSGGQSLLTGKGFPLRGHPFEFSTLGD